MATNLELITTRETAILTQLATLAGTAADNPDVDGGGMGTAQKTRKIASLYAELREIRQLKQLYQGPVEIVSVGRG